MRLGEQLGVVDHISSFWRFRFPPGRPARCSAEELIDLFMDFEESLGVDADQREGSVRYVAS